MNKLFYTLMVFLQSFSGCFAQPFTVVEHMPKTYDLKGNVKEIRQFLVAERSGELVKGRPLNTFKYDGKGTCIEDSFSIDQDRLIHIIKYDEKGNLAEDCRYKSNGALSMKITYKYDDRGNKIEWRRYFSDEKLDGRGTFKYDEKGHEIESCSYDSNGNLKERHTHKYDRKGYLKKWGKYNTNRKLEWGHTYKRNSKGKIKECTCKSYSGIRWKDKYEYDAQSRLYKKRRYNYCRKLVEESIHKFNEVEKYVYDSDKNVIAKKEITKYDNLGNEIEKCVYDSDGHLLAKHTHKYDDRGNEIEHVKTNGENGGLIYGIIVEYVYYE